MLTYHNSELTNMKRHTRLVRVAQIVADYRAGLHGYDTSILKIIRLGFSEVQADSFLFKYIDETEKHGG